MPYIYEHPRPHQAFIGKSQHTVYTEAQVQEMMEHRCEEQGHQYDNCCSVTFQVYQSCRWCGARR
jgi:hypothetical protein